MTFDLYEGHMIKNNFFKYPPPPPRHHSSGKTTCYTALCFDTPVHTIENASWLDFGSNPLKNVSFMGDFLTPSNLRALNLGQPPIIFLSIAFRAIKCIGR